MMRAYVYFVILVVATACGDTIPRTQVMLVIDAESGVRSQTTDVQIVVRGGTGAMSQWQERLDRSLTLGDGAEWPMEVSLTPLGGDASRVYEATATAMSADGDAVALVRAVSGYREGATLVLRLLFEDDCRSQVDACSATQTCRAGACVDANVEVETLETFKPGVAVDVGFDAGTDSGGSDAGVDASSDASSDASVGDAGTDTGPPEPLAWCGLCSEGGSECGEGLFCHHTRATWTCQFPCECIERDPLRCTPCGTGEICLGTSTYRQNPQGQFVYGGVCASEDFANVNTTGGPYIPQLSNIAMENACLDLNQ